MLSRILAVSVVFSALTVSSACASSNQTRLLPAEFEPMGSTRPLFSRIPPSDLGQREPFSINAELGYDYTGYFRYPGQRAYEPFPNPLPVALPAYDTDKMDRLKTAYRQCPALVLGEMKRPAYMRSIWHEDVLLEDGVFITDGETYSSVGWLYAQCIRRQSGMNIALAKCGNSPRQCSYPRLTPANQ